MQFRLKYLFVATLVLAILVALVMCVDLYGPSRTDLLQGMNFVSENSEITFERSLTTLKFEAGANLDDHEWAHLRSHRNVYYYEGVDRYCYDFTGTNFSDVHLKHIYGTARLDHVIFTGSKVTKAGIAQFKSKMPDCEVTE